MSHLPHIVIKPQPDIGIIICKHHQYCILPSSLMSHFSTLHSDHVNPTERRAMQKEIEKLQEMLHQDYTQIRPPQEPHPVIRGLRIHTASLRCNQCAHIVAGKTTIESMKKHLRTHGINADTINKHQRHNNLNAAQWAQYWRVIQSQQLFTRASGVDNEAVKHFEVYEPNEQETTMLSDHPSDAEDAPDHKPVDPVLSRVDALQAQFEQAETFALKEMAERRAHVPTPTKRQTNPYLEHTRFQTIVRGMAWQEIRQYTQSAGNDEAALRYLEATVKSMVLVYQHTVAATSRWARIRVMQEDWQVIPRTPLFHYQGFDLRHSLPLVKVFIFFYRVCVLGAAQPHTLHMTHTQQIAWQAIQEHLDGMPRPLPSRELMHERTNLDNLESLCHQFWLSLIEQTSVRQDFEISLVTPLAFIAVDSKSDRFRAAYNFATDLSAIKKLARFAACQRLWAVTQESGNENIAPNQSVWDEGVRDLEQDEVGPLVQEQEEARKARDGGEQRHRSLHDQFKDWIYHYLTTEYPTAMAWVITTVRYIGCLRYGETLDAFVRWNGSTVTVRYITTTFDRYRAMVWALHD